MLATVLGALLLGGLVIGGMALSAGGDGRVSRPHTDAVRAYLAKGNVEGAKTAIEHYEADGGDEGHVVQLRKRCAPTWGGETAKKINDLLAADRVNDARALLRDDDESLPTDLRTHVTSLAQAEEALRAAA